MKALPWFRMWSEAVDDEKLRMLAFEDRWHFVALLCLKAKGILDERDPALRQQKICIKLGLDSLECETVMKRLVTVGLINSKGQPVNWTRRQFKSDSSTSRVQRFRERERNVSETPSEAESEADTEEEKTGERTDVRQRRPAAPRLAARLPDDFSLTPERVLVATREAVVPQRTFDKFCDHWRAASGANARKRDWDAAWRNWCRTEADRGKPRVAVGSIADRIVWRPTE